VGSFHSYQELESRQRRSPNRRRGLGEGSAGLELLRNSSAPAEKFIFAPAASLGFPPSVAFLIAQRSKMLAKEIVVASTFPGCFAIFTVNNRNTDG
jgi:hypothetical protein